jgi:hypothetical protein
MLPLLLLLSIGAFSKTKEEMMSVTRRILIAVGFNQWVQKQQAIRMPK